MTNGIPLISLVTVALPETDLARIRRYCDAQTPDDMRDQIRIEFRTRGHTVTIVECRPPWSGAEDAGWTELEAARMKYDESTRGWTLYWFDSNSKAHLYDRVKSNVPLMKLLDEIESDPTNIFWG